ncbi:hypothetical protein SAMN04488564_10178 [Lentzea waywayandensis]|uniref:Uncharacterized protein n=1 Tax=Lentzea waywayandensis TaxID=84724 RepID=A0A1I6CQB3_9PSEU|nr:hypothetical protein [Lentzea waywayandensis]SFQ95343.1 hypothetical protein SAMN04488564_10178 [Lentzea waywayandensis]
MSGTHLGIYRALAEHDAKHVPRYEQGAGYAHVTTSQGFCLTTSGSVVPQAFAHMTSGRPRLALLEVVLDLID